MSFKAKFKANGKEANVLNCHYALKQETDDTGRPSSITRGGKITLTIESTDQTNWFEAMCNNFDRISGSIVYIKRDSDATLKELKFTEAYVTAYEETFDHANGKPLMETFTLSAKEIELGSGKHTNEWV
jgi:hypothetical protein